MQLKKLFFVSINLKWLRQIEENSANDWTVLNSLISVRDGPCECSPRVSRNLTTPCWGATVISERILEFRQDYKIQNISFLVAPLTPVLSWLLTSRYCLRPNIVTFLKLRCDIICAWTIRNLLYKYLWEYLLFQVSA